MKPPFRIGFGFDVHQMVEGRPFWLGGVLIDHYKGAKGHSDADVLLHAICDALLGAANLADLGQHCPDTDATYKNIDSKILLNKTTALLQEKNWLVGNIDCSICLEKPKIMKHAAEMKAAIAEAMGISVDCISIKATTNEQMGFIGRETGIVAYAVALIYLK